MSQTLDVSLNLHVRKGTRFELRKAGTAGLPRYLLIRGEGYETVIIHLWDDTLTSIQKVLLEDDPEPTTKET